MVDEIVTSANPEVAPAGGVVSGASLDAYLKKIQIQNDTLDRIIAEGKLKGADTQGVYRQKEDLRLESGKAIDQANRVQGEANVMGQVAEWKRAPGMEKIPNVSGIYRMPAATGVPPREESPDGSPYSRRFLEEAMNYRRPIKGVDVPSIPGESAGDLRKRMEAQWKAYDEDEKVNSYTRMRNYEVGLLRRWADSGRPIPPDYVMSGTVGGHPLTSKELDIIIGEGKYKIANKPNPTYSNIGVMPGRTYGDFRKEREYDQQLNLADIKARETDSASDKLVRDRIKALARPKAELEKIIHSSDPLNTTENKNAARAELDKLDAQEAVLAAQIRGVRPARKPYEPEIKEGWDSYLGKAKALTAEPAATPPAGATADYLMGGATPKGEAPEGTRITSKQGDELVKQGGRWVKVPTAEGGPVSDYANQDSSSYSGAGASRFVNQTKKPVPGRGKFTSGPGIEVAERPVQPVNTTEPVERPVQHVNDSGQSLVNRLQTAITPGLNSAQDRFNADVGNEGFQVKLPGIPASGIGIKAAQEQFNADVKGGLKVDEAILRVARKFGADTAKQLAALLKSSRATAAPPVTQSSYLDTIERMQ